MQGYDEIASAEKEGISYYVYTDDDRVKTHTVATPADFADAVWKLSQHALNTIADIERQSGRQVTEVTVGKTYVKKNKRRTGCFPVDEPHNWVLNGPQNRWGSTYLKRKCQGLIVFHCFTRADLPPALVINGMNHEELSLSYERAVTKYIQQNKPHPQFSVANADAGGGGRTSGGAYAGYVLYLAFKLAPPPVQLDAQAVQRLKQALKARGNTALDITA